VDKKFNCKGSKEMKVEISEDQNTLTVDGVEYEAKLNNAKPHESCKSCVFLYDGFFCKIAMETPSGLNPSDVRHCEYPYRNDGKSIFWVKKEVEQMSKQNINFLDDENTLTVDGVEYEARTGGHACDDCSFWRVDSFNGCLIGGMAFSKCAPKNRADGKSIHWIKKEQKMTEA